VITPRTLPPFFCVVLVRNWAFRIAVTGLLLGLLCPVGASGFSSWQNKHEQPYALIYGTVWGPDDRPVTGVRVKIRRENEKKVRWEVYSTRLGEFTQRVPAGKADYVIWADLKGYRHQNGRHLQPGEEVKVHVEFDERVDTGLHLK